MPFGSSVILVAIPHGEISARLTLTCNFTFSHFADAFIQSDLQLGNT